MGRLMIARCWWRLLFIALVVSCILSTQDEAQRRELGRRLAELETEMFSYHKDFFPLGLGDVLCFFVAGSSLVVAAGGGIGGGGILVSLYMLFLNFRPRHAVALSNFTILGGALANTLVNLLQRDENGQSMIDWNIIVMMEPATIAGTIVGSFLSKYLADFVLMVFLILVLAALSFRTLDKGLEMFNHETTQGPQALPQEEEEHDASDEEDAKESRNLVAGNDLRRVQRSPSTKVSLLVCCFLGCVILTVLKGSGHGSIVGVTCGSLSFWLLTWATLPWVLGFGMIFRDILINEHLENEEDGHDYHCEEIRWNAVNTIRYPLLCSLAGVLAGLFGVGGGIIKGPLMLELGVEPQVAGATASTMILFTSASAAVSFQVFGLLKGDYGAFCFILGFSCTLLGQVAIQRWMQETKRPSVTVLSIGLVLAISTVLLVMEMIGHMARTEDLQKLVLPTSLCNIND